jgi:hypothetical protein
MGVVYSFCLEELERDEIRNQDRAMYNTIDNLEERRDTLKQDQRDLNEWYKRSEAIYIRDRGKNPYQDESRMLELGRLRRQIQNLDARVAEIEDNLHQLDAIGDKVEKSKFIRQKRRLTQNADRITAQAAIGPGAVKAARKYKEKVATRDKAMQEFDQVLTDTIDVGPMSGVANSERLKKQKEEDAKVAASIQRDLDERAARDSANAFDAIPPVALKSLSGDPDVDERLDKFRASEIRKPERGPDE